MVYHRIGREAWFVEVPTRFGRRIKRSTGTAHRGTAIAIERMLIALGPKGRRDWELLERVAAGTLELGTLYDAWQRNDLDGLRRQLDDVDLAAHVAGWSAWLADRVKPATADHYSAHLATLMPPGQAFYRSDFKASTVAAWLATRTALVAKRRPSETHSRRMQDPPPRAVSGSTKRKYLAATQSFATYLLEIGVLETNPIRDVSAPPAGRPRCQFLELPDVHRLVEGAPVPYRALFAIAYGAGLEVSAILSLIETDVDCAHRQLRARGTKAWSRDRIARVADWAWGYVTAHLATLMPGERLFRGLSRWHAGDAHRERCGALGLLGYRLHDARHHWAVRMVRAGMPLELVARQLGHVDVVMVARVYGRWVPQHHERDRWERAAAALDIEQFGKQIVEKMGTSAGTSLRNDKSQPPVSDWPVNSRGGTRTRDPGIMSLIRPPWHSGQHSQERGIPRHRAALKYARHGGAHGGTTARSDHFPASLAFERS